MFNAAKCREARISLGLSQAKLGALVGVSLHSIFRLENGTRQPRTEELQALARVLGVAPNTLMSSTDETKKRDLPVNEDLGKAAGVSPDVTVLTPQQIRRVDVPLLSAEITACCGAGIPTYNEIQNPPSEVYKYTIEEIGGSYDDMRPPFAVRADGACLEKSRIFDGDVLIVNPALTPRQGQICVVNWEGALSAKRVVRNADGSITLHSDADTYAISAEAAANPVHFSIWGVVVASRRAIR